MDMDDDLEPQGSDYIRTWVRLFNVLAGWPEEVVLKWAQHYQDRLADPDDVFFHEPASYHALPALIPPRLRGMHPYDRMRLEGQIQDAIEDGDAFWDNRPDFDWEAAKRRVECVLNKYGESLTSLRLEGEEREPE